MKTSQRVWLAAALLVGAAFAAYANTFGVPFLFDDQPSILDNPSILSWRTALNPPRGFGFTVSGRPLLNLTLAANYALGGVDVRGYHALNLLIHVAAGLVLFGLARRTLGGCACQPQNQTTHRLEADATWTAFTLTLLWMLHPLQTEAVTYIIQRAESLMTLMFLLTLYCFARAAGSCHVLRDKGESITGGAKTECHVLRDTFRGRAEVGWKVAAVVACALGMGCKEVMVAAPIVVLLYDRTFFAGDFRTAWRARRGFYVALFGTWLPLAWLVVSTGGNRGGTFQFTAGAMSDYWRAQCEALVIYLKLVAWPAPLVFEYGPLHVSGLRLIASGAVVVALLVATLWALRRRPMAGFCGASFFLILAPTCLVPGVTQTMAEHRMYLPLAAVLALAVGGAVACFGRRAIVIAIGLGLVGGVMTARRNADYQSDFTLWQDSVAKRPGSALGQSALGTAYFQRGKFSEALTCYAASLRIDGSAAKIHFNAGLALEALGRRPEALAHYTEATRLLPHFAQAHAKLGAGLIAAGRVDEALGHLQEALSYDPKLVEARNSLGLALVESGRVAEAVPCFRAALELQPNFAEAECNWGAAECRLGNLGEARRHLRRALELRPDLADAHFNLGLVAAAAGRDDEAQAEYRETVRVDPNHGEARLNFGIALAQAGLFAEALGQLREAVRLRPQRPEAHANLGITLAELGRLEEAVASYEVALRLRPDYAQARYNLGNALVQQRRWAEARAQFAEAVRLRPDFAAAREMLQRLEDAPSVR